MTALLPAVVVAAWAGAGMALLVRRRAGRAARAVLVGAALGAVASAGIARSVTVVALALVPAVGLHALLALADDDAPGPWVAWAYLLAGGVGAVLALAGPARVAWLVAVEAGVAAVVALVAVCRTNADGSRHGRQRLRWMAWAVVTAALVAGAAVVARVLQGQPVDAGPLLAGASLVFPLSLVLAESPRLGSRVDELLVATVDLTGLAVLVGAVGLLLLAGLDRLPTASDRRAVGTAMAAALAVGALSVPLHARLSRLGTRLVYGARDAPDHVLHTLSNHLSRSVPLEELLIQVAELLRTTLALDAAEIWTGSGGRLQRVVSVPHRGPALLRLGPQEEAVVAAAGFAGGAWTRIWLPHLLDGHPAAVLGLAPIRHAGALLGLVVARRGDAGGTFGEDEQAVLVELGRQLGLTLHNLELDSALQASLVELRRRAEELQASRARIVAASDAARRDIERNLHDGAQQHLIALIATLRLALQTARTDPPAANALLEEVGRGLQVAVQELRTLAHGIYPPLLVERGLGEALAASARTAGLPTRVDADGAGRYPLDREAAVYFCCLEALQNATKHAGPDAVVTISVREEAGDLLFEVADDGRGFDGSARGCSGAGFLNMNDRLGAIGGTLTVESTPGHGTRVSGRVPVGRSTPAGGPTPDAPRGTAGPP